MIKDEEYYEEVFLKILENMEKNTIIVKKEVGSKLIKRTPEKLDERCRQCDRTVSELMLIRKSMKYFGGGICVSCRQKNYQNSLKNLK